MGEVAQSIEIEVSDHAMWKAAERFPRFDTARIEREVRSALASGRVSASREHLGLHPSSESVSLYAWTEDGRRVYALNVHATDGSKFVVTTTMRGGAARARPV